MADDLLDLVDRRMPVPGVFDVGVAVAHTLLFRFVILLFVF